LIRLWLLLRIFLYTIVLWDLIHIRCVRYRQAFYRVKSYSVRFRTHLFAFD
jgi:hypothetical protein